MSAGVQGVQSLPVRGRLAARVTAALLALAALALAWWGYRDPELFLVLVRFPLC